MNEQITTRASELPEEEAVQQVKDRIKEKIRSQFAIPFEEASPEQIYEAVGLCVRDDISDFWIEGRTSTQRAGAKCVIYLSAEFLIGRLLTNNLIWANTISTPKL